MATAFAPSSKSRFASTSGGRCQCTSSGPAYRSIAMPVSVGGSEGEEPKRAVLAPDPRPGEVLHEDPRPPVDRARSVGRERVLVGGRRVAPIRLEAVGGEVLGLGRHDRIAGDLGD